MLGRLLTRLYSQLLKLYPDRFLKEFGGEMKDVFAQVLSGLNDPGTPIAARRVKMVRLFFREVRYFPLSYLDARRYLKSFRSSETPQGNTPYREGEVSETWVGQPDAWGEALLGALPFLLYGIACLLEGFTELGGHPPLALTLLDKSINRPAIALTPQMGVHIVTALGLLFGVWKGFPRWSYAYLGVTIFFGWSYNNQNYYGVLNKPWAWFPLFAAILLGLLLTRSLQPLAQLFKGAWNDWTRLSFTLYAFTSPLVIGSIFDLDWGASHLYSVFFLTFVISAGAVTFLRSRGIWGRVLSLQAVVLILVVTGMRYPSFVEDLLALHRQAFQFMLIYFGWLLMPMVIGMVKWGVDTLSSR